MADDAIAVFQTGSIIAFGAASSRVAIPNDSSGAVPKYVRVAANAACYVKVGNSTVTAADGDVLVQPADAVILKTGNQTHIAAIQVSAAGTVQISPIEDR